MPVEEQRGEEQSAQDASDAQGGVNHVQSPPIVGCRDKHRALLLASKYSPFPVVGYRNK